MVNNLLPATASVTRFFTTPHDEDDEERVKMRWSSVLTWAIAVDPCN